MAPPGDNGERPEPPEMENGQPPEMPEGNDSEVKNKNNKEEKSAETTSEEESVSTKGLKAGGNLTITSGNFNNEFLILFLLSITNSLEFLISLFKLDKVIIMYIRAMQPNVASIKYIIFKSMYILSLCIFFSYFSIFY